MSSTLLANFFLHEEVDAYKAICASFEHDLKAVFVVNVDAIEIDFLSHLRHPFIVSLMKFTNPQISEKAAQRSALLIKSLSDFSKVLVELSRRVANFTKDRAMATSYLRDMISHLIEITHFTVIGNQLVEVDFTQFLQHRFFSEELRSFRTLGGLHFSTFTTKLVAAILNSENGKREVAVNSYIEYLKSYAPMSNGSDSMDVVVRYILFFKNISFSSLKNIRFRQQMSMSLRRLLVTSASRRFLPSTQSSLCHLPTSSSLNMCESYFGYLEFMKDLISLICCSPPLNI